MMHLPTVPAPRRPLPAVVRWRPSSGPAATRCSPPPRCAQRRAEREDVEDYLAARSPRHAGHRRDAAAPRTR